MDLCISCFIAFFSFLSNVLLVEATLTKVTPELKQLILDAHNTVRRLAAPDGANMMKMYWDEGLEEKAALHAERYTNEHDKYYDRYAEELPGVATGQNMCYGGGMSWTSCMEMWFEEINHFQYGVGPTNGDIALIAHIAQVMYWKTSRVGCARSFCGCTVYFVCNYGYSMIYEDIEKPWNNGGNCSMCPDNCEDGLCDCGGKMCMNDGDLNPATCQCKCRNAPNSPFYGEECEFLDCGVKDPFWCGQLSPAYKDEYCKVYANTRNDCPHYCGRCE